MTSMVGELCTEASLLVGYHALQFARDMGNVGLGVDVGDASAPTCGNVPRANDVDDLVDRRS